MDVRNIGAEDDPRTNMKDVVFPKAVFTQSNWTGKVARESWYGKHAPWQRIVFFVVLSAWAQTLSTMLSLFAFDVFGGDDSMRIPILLATTEEELNAIKETHADCLESLCEDIGRAVDVDCVVNDDGKTGHVEYGDDVPEQIFFPQACHDATEATFGFPYLNGDEELGTKPMAFITLQREDKSGLKNETAVPPTAPKSILTLLPECSVIVNSNPDMSPEEMETIREKLNIDAGEWENLYQEFRDESLELTFTLDLLRLTHNRQHVAGYRETHVLKRLLCPDEMTPDIQQKVIPQVAVIYNFLIDYLMEILAVVIFAWNSFFATTTLCWLMVRLIMPAVLMKRLLPWPHRSIRFWDIWRTLLLLCVVSCNGLTSVALSAFLALGALFYRDNTAAMEWSFLGMLAWSADDTIYPYLDFLVGDPLSELKGVNALRMLLRAVIIGEGWWKLVTIYVVARSYQGLQATRPSTKNALEQTQLHLGDANRQQHNILGEEHAKTD